MYKRENSDGDDDDSDICPNGGLSGEEVRATKIRPVAKKARSDKTVARGASRVRSTAIDNCAVTSALSHDTSPPPSTQKGDSAFNCFCEANPRDPVHQFFSIMESTFRKLQPEVQYYAEEMLFLVMEQSKQRQEEIMISKRNDRERASQ